HPKRVLHTDHEYAERRVHPGSHALTPVNPDVAFATAEEASAGAHPGYETCAFINRPTYSAGAACMSACGT
ncbi:hypothetical protein, partial [Bradyrhizobium sp. STM 3809]|uniref:hypothetical protein n=1 Tax=Bradyrhizobium sp. STM 3809 TaxID=551936 RepID=UPI00054E74A2